MGVDLDRFLQAQAAPWAGWEVAITELRRGRKRSHWIWYVFPQLRGLGRSANAHAYGIDDVEEAAAYLRHPVLGRRYAEGITAVRGHLGRRTIERVMGGEVDAQKLVSSLTLFRAAAARCPDLDWAGRLIEAIDAILAAAAGDGLPPCAFTARAVAEGSGGGDRGAGAGT